MSHPKCLVNNTPLSLVTAHPLPCRAFEGARDPLLSSSSFRLRTTKRHGPALVHVHLRVCLDDRDGLSLAPADGAQGW